MVKIFCAFNFCRITPPRKYFNGKLFPNCGSQFPPLASQIHDTTKVTRK